MSQNIVMTTCGGCYHKLDSTELMKCTSFDGDCKVSHWYIPLELASKIGYKPCRWCYEDGIPDSCYYQHEELDIDLLHPYGEGL